MGAYGGTQEASMSLGEVSALPTLGQISHHCPADGEKGVDVHVQLSWSRALYAHSYDIYFGTSNPPPFVRNQADTTYSPAMLERNVDYYWRVDAVNGNTKAEGEILAFRTSFW